MTEPEVDEAEWLFHLSTLFPEVRPKEYFELRSADTIEPSHLVAPLVFVTGLVYDPDASVSATEILASRDDDPMLLPRAASLGLKDPEVFGLAAVLFSFAIEGATRLGEDYISARYREEARVYIKSLIDKFKPR